MLARHLAHLLLRAVFLQAVCIPEFAWQNAGGGALEYLYLGQLVIQLSFLACAGAIFYTIPVPSPLTIYRDDLPWAFARTAVYAAIWVTYVLCSDQVKSTFLEPFRQRYR